MQTARLSMILAMSVIASVAHTQAVTDPVAIAEAQGVCGPFGVQSATIDVDGTIRAICNEDATAFAPLLGGLGPALGAGAAAAVAAAIANGNATPDTQ